VRTARESVGLGLVIVALVALGAVVVSDGSARRRSRPLLEFENTVFSQAGEDGILERIFQIIEPTERFAIEFGAGDGIDMSNVRKLIVREGWGGLLIEGDDELAQRLRDTYLEYPAVRTLQAWVYPANVELLFEENGVPRDLDLLVIDIDSNDYYVWRTIRAFRPKVVMVEFNGTFAPPQRMVIAFHPMMWWSEEDFHFGASIQSLHELGQRKGYELVATNSRGVNLFFVDRQYYARFGIADNSPAAFFRPYNLGPTFSPEDIKAGTAPPPSEDIVMDEVRIEKRYRFDR
jgi:hypothetical protein